MFVHASEIAVNTNDISLQQNQSVFPKLQIRNVLQYMPQAFWGLNYKVARFFAIAIYFHPSLTFLDKAGAYQSGGPYGTYSNRKLGNKY